MIHVSILVPHSSVLPNSVVGLFRIFDLANRCSAEGSSGPAFDLHLVGSGVTAGLYGGDFTVKPDLTLSQVAATDLAIIPAMAGNIAEAIKNNPAFIPWIQKQYRAGSEIAGLCTGAFFLADSGLIHEKDCSPHWFVDAVFREQYSQINSLAERTAADAAESIHSDRGAWLFLQKLLERVAGKQAALACSTAFQDPFNRECQSILSVSDPRRRHASRIEKNEHIPEMTVERFSSLFDVNYGDRECSSSVAALFEESLQAPAGNTNPNVCRPRAEYEAQGRTDNQNPRTFKALLRRIERPETSYGNG